MDTEVKKNIVVKNKKGTKHIFRNILFFVIWLYLILKLFIIGPDVFLIKELGFQNIGVYTLFRFLLSTIILLIIWKAIGNKRFFKNLGLFFLFPIYPGFWLLIKAIFWDFPSLLLTKQLHFIFYSYVEFILRFIAEFKLMVIKAFAFIISFFIVYNLGSYWLIAPILLLLFLQFAHIYRRFNQIFSPLKIFRLTITSDFEDKNPFSIRKIEKEAQLKNSKQKLTDDQVNFNQIEQILMFWVISNALGNKVRNILNNSTYLKSVFWKVAYSFFMSVIFLGGINFALYRLNSTNFQVDTVPSYFNFCYYSFFTVFSDGTDIYPLTEIAKGFRMLGVTIGVVLNIIILTFYLTTFTEKYKSNLSKLISYFEFYSKEVNDHIESKYKTNPKDFFENMKNKSGKIRSLIKALEFIFSDT